MTWQTLGRIDPTTLTRARCALHHAIQIPALAIGKRFVPSSEDDSHTTLEWAASHWISQPIPGTDGLHVRLSPDLSIHLDGSATSSHGSLHLPGISREGALTWLADGLRDQGLEVDDLEIDPHYELPAHPVADEGATWRGDDLASTQEIGRYFANAARVLHDVATEHPDPTPVRTWPHHFDIARLLPVGPDDDRMQRTVGIGLSPGDEHYDQPYFYVNAYPQPDAPDLPTLPHGEWRTEGFFAAILTGTELLTGDDREQEARVRAFFTDAIEATKSLLR